MISARIMVNGHLHQEACLKGKSSRTRERFQVGRSWMLISPQCCRSIVMKRYTDSICTDLKISGQLQSLPLRAKCHWTSLTRSPLTAVRIVAHQRLFLLPSYVVASAISFREGGKRDNREGTFYSEAARPLSICARTLSPRRAYLSAIPLWLLFLA